MTDTLIGQVIDGYAIQKLLGQGGMARVYRAVDVALNRYVAIKVIDPEARDDSAYRERFRREARAVAQLEHPNIVSVYRFGEHNSLYYMAMSFIDGADLRWLLHDYRASGELIPHDDLVNIVAQIARGLDYAHSKGVIHRDIKPSNIMLTANNDAIITDFGLALTTTEKSSGSTFGSAYYIAPEQAINSAGAVPQSDLYSLGVVVFEMLTGDVPFRDGSAIQIAMAHATEPVPVPQLINPTLSEAFNPVLETALAKDPQQRYSNGVKLIAALRAAVRQAKEEQPPTNPRPRRARPAPMISAVDAAAKLTTFQKERVLPEVIDPPTVIAPAPVQVASGQRRLVLLGGLMAVMVAAALFVLMTMQNAPRQGSGGTTPAPTDPLALAGDGPAVTMVIEGPVRAINGRTLTIYDLDVTLAEGSPLLAARVGDSVVLLGDYEMTESGVYVTSVREATLNGRTVIAPPTAEAP